MPSENLLPHLPDAIAFIKAAIQKGGNVFVHCYAGVSRSASTIIAFLMMEKKMGFIEAANYVRKQRPVIFPNIGFQRQLLQLEEYIKRTKADPDNISVMSKSKRSVRSVKPETRSEHRSNYRSSASVYRGKHAQKYKLRQSLKISKERKLMQEKGHRSYKEKAKNYYLGMKNNWVGDTKERIKQFDDYQLYNSDRKSKTTNLVIDMVRKTAEEVKLTKSLLENKQDPQGQKSLGVFKRLNKQYYQDKYKEGNKNGFKQPNYTTPK